MPRDTTSQNQGVIKLANKRGRPRKTPIVTDQGTPELQARRGADQRHSYPLGILYMSGDITEEQHQAGCWYAWLYGFTCGRTSSAAINWDAQPGGNRDDWNPGLTAKLEQYFKAAANTLARDRKAKDAIDNLVVYSRHPRWMTPRRPTLGCVREADAFHRGMAQLVDLFAKYGGSAQRAA